MATLQEVVDDEQPAPPPVIPVDPAVETEVERPSRVTRLRDKRAAREDVVRDSRPLTSPERMLETEETKSLLDWFRTLDVGAPVRVVLKRREPKEHVDPATGRAVKTDGQLTTFDRMVDEEEIRRKYGGGSYMLTVLRESAKGNYVYFKTRQVEIAGDPLLTGLSIARPDAPPVMQQSAPSNDGPVMLKMMDMMGRHIERASSGGGDQGAIISAALAPLQAMLAQMQSQLEQKDRQIAEARKGDPQETSFREKMLSNLMDQETARITALRTQHESEMRQSRELANANELRLRDQHARDLDHANRVHDRELATIRDAHTTALAAQTAANNLQVMMLQGENKRLDKEVTDLKADIKILRDKKDPSLKDKLEEMNEIKELMGGDDDGGDKSSTIVKVIEGVAGSSKMGAIVGRIMGEGPQQQQQIVQVTQAQVQAAQAQQRQQRIRMARDLRTGLPVGVSARGEVRAARRREPLPAAGQSAAPAQPEAPAVPYIAPEQVTQAAEYMTAAFTNGTDPLVFAESARAFVSADILSAIRSMGVDDFLGKVAQLESSHHLRSQGGRNWTTKVAKALLGQ